MDIKLKYRAWVGEKHADISSTLTNSDIETFTIEFTEWLVKNCLIFDDSNSICKPQINDECKKCLTHQCNGCNAYDSYTN